MQYKVVNSIKTGQYDSQFGEVDSTGKKVMYKYTVQLEGESEPVEVSQKPSTAAPKQGDILNGTIEATPFGKRFKKEKSGGFQGGSKSNYDPDGAAWGNALTNATNLVIAYGKETGLKPEDFPTEILKVAESLFNGRPKAEVKTEQVTPQVKAPTVELDDLPPVEAYDNESPF